MAVVLVGTHRVFILVISSSIKMHSELSTRKNHFISLLIGHVQSVNDHVQSVNWLHLVW